MVDYFLAKIVKGKCDVVLGLKKMTLGDGLVAETDLLAFYKDNEIVNHCGLIKYFCDKEYVYILRTGGSSAEVIDFDKLAKYIDASESTYFSEVAAAAIGVGKSVTPEYLDCYSSGWVISEKYSTLFEAIDKIREDYEKINVQIINSDNYLQELLNNSNTQLELAEDAINEHHLFSKLRPKEKAAAISYLTEFMKGKIKEENKDETQEEPKDNEPKPKKNPKRKNAKKKKS